MSRIVEKSERDLVSEGIKIVPIRKPGPIKIWKTIDGFRTVGDETKPVKINIQEIPEDRHEDLLDHMSTYFLVDEPCCSCLKLIEDPSSVKEFRGMWKIILNQGLSIGAFVEDPNGGKPEIAGVNFTGVEVKDDYRKIDQYQAAWDLYDSHFKDENFKWPERKVQRGSYTSHMAWNLQSVLVKRIIDPVISLCKEAKIYEHYNTDRYMFAFGLSVHPYYRGHNLGAHILNARDQVCREYDIPATATAFTSTISQKSAARCGYEVLLTKDYDQMLDEEGKEIFPNIKFKTFKVMGKKFY